MSDDIFQDNEKQAFKKIAQAEHKSKLTENYEVGYHGGLIHSMEKNEEELIWKTIKENFLIEKDKVRQKLGQFAKIQFQKFVKNQDSQNGTKTSSKANNESKQKKGGDKKKELIPMKISQSKNIDF